MGFEFQSRHVFRVLTIDYRCEIGVKRDIRKHKYQVARAVYSHSISFANLKVPDKLTRRGKIR